MKDTTKFWGILVTLATLAFGAALLMFNMGCAIPSSDKDAYPLAQAQFRHVYAQVADGSAGVEVKADVRDLIDFGWYRNILIRMQAHPWYTAATVIGAGVAGYYGYEELFPGSSGGDATALPPSQVNVRARNATVVDAPQDGTYSIDAREDVLLDFQQAPEPVQ